MTQARSNLIVQETLRILPIFLHENPGTHMLVKERRLVVRMLRQYADYRTEGGPGVDLGRRPIEQALEWCQSEPSHLLADGYERLVDGEAAKIREEIESKYAEQWNASGWFKRWFLFRKIEREIAQRVAERTERVSREALFWKTVVTARNHEALPVPQKNSRRPRSGSRNSSGSRRTQAAPVDDESEAANQASHRLRIHAGTDGSKRSATARRVCRVVARRRRCFGWTGHLVDAVVTIAGSACRSHRRRFDATKLATTTGEPTEMLDETVSIDGIQVPRFLYGTAWKEEATEGLVELALQQGFRGIDTANQRRHYHEAGVGRGVSTAIERGLMTRDELFLQTKFTFQAGQDHRLPYDPKTPIATQVEQSLNNSLEHLGTDRVDSFILHGPSQPRGLGPSDWEAWQAMESAHDDGRARLLGVSNVDLEQLQQLCERARVRPRFVQNRCFARTGWNRAVREYCAANEITYQGFSLLTANQEVLSHPDVTAIAERYRRPIPPIIFRFALDVGMLPLTGTTDEQHMKDDLGVFDFQLESDEVERIERLATR
jgi:diketogulonate reductase-like aldo/keto reductase